MIIRQAHMHGYACMHACCPERQVQLGYAQMKALRCFCTQLNFWHELHSAPRCLRHAAVPDRGPRCLYQPSRAAVSNTSTNQQAGKCADEQSACSSAELSESDSGPQHAPVASCRHAACANLNCVCSWKLVQGCLHRQDWLTGFGAMRTCPSPLCMQP